jgi:hypothetical protein
VLALAMCAFTARHHSPTAANAAFPVRVPGAPWSALSSPGPAGR